MEWRWLCPAPVRVRDCTASGTTYQIKTSEGERRGGQERPRSIEKKHTSKSYYSCPCIKLVMLHKSKRKAHQGRGRKRTNQSMQERYSFSNKQRVSRWLQQEYRGAEQCRSSIYPTTAHLHTKHSNNRMESICFTCKCGKPVESFQLKKRQ